MTVIGASSRKLSAANFASSLLGNIASSVLCVCEARGAEHGDDQLRRHRFPGQSVDHREGGAGVIDEHAHAGDVALPHSRLPSSADGPVPLVFAISGLDSRKENLADTYGALVDRGIGFFTLDSPGAGQSPVQASPTADRVFSRVLDYLAGRKEIDPKRIVVHGVS